MAATLSATWSTSFMLWLMSTTASPFSARTRRKGSPKPEAILKDIYEKLDLGDYARTEGAVKAYLSDKGPYTPNVFELPDDLRAKIVKRWAGYFERFGYEREVEEVK